VTLGWRVEQTLESYAAPLGKQFLANGQSVPRLGQSRCVCCYVGLWRKGRRISAVCRAEAVANKVLSEQQNQLGKTIDFELRPPCPGMRGRVPKV